MLRIALAALVAAPATGCLDPIDDDIIQWHDDFEDVVLRDWVATGDVTRVETYHPGEHAMRLGPGATARHPIAITRMAGTIGDRNNFSDGNWVELTTDCDGPGALALREVAPGRLALDLTLDDRGTAAFAKHRLNLPPFDPTIDVSLVELAVATDTRACRVDNLQVRISAGQLGY